jgi:hypothetical protein
MYCYLVRFDIQKRALIPALAGLPLLSITARTGACMHCRDQQAGVLFLMSRNLYAACPLEAVLGPWLLAQGMRD